jgi:hypothetical protein
MSRAAVQLVVARWLLTGKRVVTEPPITMEAAQERCEYRCWS